MGYRSTVAISIYGDQNEMSDLIQYYNTRKSTLSDGSREDLGYLLDESESNVSNGVWNTPEKLEFNFYVENVKWYEGYPAVDFIIDLMDKAKTFDNLVVEYVCIGDELEDITQEWCYNNPELNEYRLEVKRTVEWV